MDPDAMLRAFVEQTVAPLPESEARALRDRIVARMEAPRPVRTAERGRAWIVFAAAAILPIAIWAGARGLRSSTRQAGLATVTDVAGTATIQGDDLVAGPEAASRASLPSGALVEVGASSDVRFGRAVGEPTVGERIDLATGSIQVRVPKLAAGTDLRVRTRDATVVVHGTKFTVERLPGSDGTNKAHTRVSVTEGLVEVDSASGVAMLSAGMSLVVPQSSATEANPPVLAAPAETTAPPVPSTTGTASSPSSTLAAQNALLADALRLGREHPDQAVGRLDDFLARYPASPLAETARRERQRLSAEMDRGARSP
jgi:ferric-dicitrate binding protein FerR (iron transport regulator)